MSEQVSRKKSYRWAAVSQGTYDGADWDSSNSEDDNVGGWESDANQTPKALVQNSPSRQPTIDKLPVLPKLAYGKDIEEDVAIETEVTHPPVRSESRSTQSVNDDLDSLMDKISREMTPRIEPAEKFSSEDQHSSSSVVDETASAMALPQNSNESISENKSSGDFKRIPSYIDDSIGDSDEEVLEDAGVAEYSDSDEELKVSKNGYFSSRIQENESDQAEDFKVNSGVESIIEASDKSLTDGDIEQHISDLPVEEPQSPVEDHEIERNDELKHIEESSAEKSNLEQMEVNDDDLPIEEVGNSNEETAVMDNSSKESESISTSEVPEIHSEENEDLHSEIKNDKLTDVSSSEEPPVQAKTGEEYDDNESLFNQYGNNSSQSSPAHAKDVSSYTSSPAKLKQTENTDLSFMEDMYSTDDDDTNSYTQSIQKSPRGQDDESFIFKNGERDSVIDTSDEDQEDNLESPRMPREGYYAKMVNEHSSTKSSDSETTRSFDDDNLAFSSDENSITESLKGSRSSAKSSSSHSIGSSTNNSSGDNDEENNKIGVNTSPTENNSQSALRQSINLGKWRPDTDSHRSGFVQETTPSVPQGFVIDEDGEKVDLNPSALRQNRGVSTYSEVESTWNAFPSDADGHEDLDTIADTKTIYDNQTIYNVPGIMTSHGLLPPLPQDVSTLGSDLTKNINDSDSILRRLDGEKRQHSSNFKEDFSVHAPDSKEIAQINGKHVPHVNLDALISSKNKSHIVKITELKSYSQELEQFDTGLQTWINYALKSSCSDKDYIFHEYKVSRHVRDAYAHADELSKRVTMSSTVANVNQNVSHLKRKVFSHTMKEKSKGLFSSIGKKL